MESFETSILRPLIWVGDSLRQVQGFPKEVRKTRWRGIATSKRDVDLIKRRYREAQELARDA